MLDKLELNFDDSNDVCSDDLDNLDDLEDSLDVLIFTRCIFTSILCLLTFIDVFLIFSFEGTTLFNLVITM